MAKYQEIANTPGNIQQKDVATKNYIFNQTMYRIKDPTKTLDFYTRILGMTLLTKADFADAKFSLYFLGYENIEEIPNDPQDRFSWVFSRKATLELTHNWGSENDESFHYHNGNAQPQGYGHIGITVDNIDEACKRFEELGVEFQKRPQDGRMKGIAFIKDPDNYWVEIYTPETVRQYATK